MCVQCTYLFSIKLFVCVSLQSADAAAGASGGAEGYTPVAGGLSEKSKMLEAGADFSDDGDVLPYTDEPARQDDGGARRHIYRPGASGATHGDGERSINVCVKYLSCSDGVNVQCTSTVHVLFARSALATTIEYCVRFQTTSSCSKHCIVV